jgi:hypothetical protein
MREDIRKELIVLWPLPPITSLLRKLGFSEFNTEESTPEREFFSDIASARHYFTYKI